MKIVVIAFLLKAVLISAAAVFFIVFSIGDVFAQQNEASRNDTKVTIVSYSIGSPAFDKFNKTVFELVAQRTSFTVTFQSLPIKRYHLTLQNQKNSCSFNMTRTEENEKKYLWLRPSSIFFVHKFVASDITDDQRNKPILVLEGSDIQRNMEKAGYDVEGIPSRDQIAKMLSGKRAYSWIDVSIFVDAYMAKDPELDLVVDGVVFKGGTWLVCSHDTNIEVRNELKKQWDAALNSGKLADITSPAQYQELLLANKNMNPK